MASLDEPVPGIASLLPAVASLDAPAAPAGLPSRLPRSSDGGPAAGAGVEVTVGVAIGTTAPLLSVGGGTVGGGGGAGTSTLIAPDVELNGLAVLPSPLGRAAMMT